MTMCACLAMKRKALAWEPALRWHLILNVLCELFTEFQLETPMSIAKLFPLMVKERPNGSGTHQRVA